MPIRPEKLTELEERMQKLGIKDVDLVEKFVLGSGKGGQKVNKTASCVYLKHLPSGIAVKCQSARSRELNRFFARRLLCEKLEEKVQNIQTEKQQEIEKIRRQKKRRSRKQKVKMMEEKKKHSDKKQLRFPPPIVNE